MAEPVRTSPLAGVAMPERSITGAEPVTLTALPFRGKLILRGGDPLRGSRLPWRWGSTCPVSCRA